MNNRGDIIVLSVGRNDKLQSSIRRSLTEFNDDNYKFQLQQLGTLAEAETYLYAGGNVVLLVVIGDDEIYKKLNQLKSKNEYLPIVALIVDNDIGSTERALELGISQVAWERHLPGRSLGQKIYVTYEQSLLLKEAKQQQSLAHVFHDTGLMLNASLEVHEIYENLLDQLAELVKYSSASVLLVENGWATVSYHRGYGELSPEFLATLRFHINSTESLREAVRKNGHLVSDVKRDDGWVQADVSFIIQSWICIPIYVQGELVALFSLDHYNADFFSAQDLESLQSLGNIASMALNNAMMFSRMRKSLDELSTIQAISQISGHSNGVDHLLAQVTSLVADIAPGTSFGFLLPDHDQLRLHPHDSYQGTSLAIELGQTPMESMLTDGQLIITANRSRLLIPLRGEGQLLGALDFAIPANYQLSEKDKDLYMTVASEVSNGLIRLNLLVAERQRRLWAEQLQAITNQLTQYYDAENIWQNLLEQLFPLLAYDQSWVFGLESGSLKVIDERSGADSESAKVAASDIMSYVGEIDSPILLSKNLLQLQNEKGQHITVDASIVSAPIRVEGEVIAKISLCNYQKHSFTTEQVALLGSFATQAGLALQNAFLFSNRQRRVEELTVLSKLANIITQSANEYDLLSQTTRLIGQALFSHNFGLLMLDQSGEKLIVHDSYQITERATVPEWIPLEGTVTGYVARTGRSQRLDDITQSDTYLAAEPTTRSELCVPITIDQQVIGVINAESPLLAGFSAEDEHLLKTLAGQIGTGLQRLRLLENERINNANSERLRQASLSLTQTLVRQEVLQRVLAELNKVVPYDSASIVLSDKDDNELVACSGLPADIIGSRFPLENPQTRQMESTGLPLYIPDTSQDITFKAWSNEVEINSWIGVPLFARSEMIGHLSIDSVKTHAYSATQIAQVEAFASHAAIALENATFYASEQRTRRNEEIIREAIQTFTQFLDSESVYGILLEYLEKLIPYKSANLMLLSSGNSIELKSVRGYAELGIEEALHKIDLSINTHPMLRRLLLKGESQLLRYTAADSEWVIHEPTNYIQSWLGVPLISQGVVLGCFQLDHDEPGFFTEEHRILAEAISGPAAAALQNAYLLETAQHTAIQVQTSQNIIALLNAQTEAENILPALLRQMLEISNARQIIYFSHDDGTVFVKASTFSGENVHLPESFPREALGPLAASLDGELFFVEDIATIGPYPIKDILLNAKLKSVLLVPVNLPDRVLGAIAIGWDHKHKYDSRQLSFFRQITSALGLALERSRLYIETKRRTAELGAISDFTSAMRMATNAESVMQILLENSFERLDSDLVTIFMSDQPEAEYVAAKDYPPISPAPRRYPISAGIVGQVLQSGEYFISSHLRDESALHKVDTLKELVNLASAIFLPLKTASGSFGVLRVGWNDSHLVSSADIRLLNAFVEVASTAIERSQILTTLEDRVEDRTRQLADANERLQELDKLKSKFVSDVTHELRTPITNLGLYMELLTNGRPEKQAQYLVVLNRQVDRLGTLVQDILNLSRIDLGKIDVATFRKFDFNKVVEQATAPFKHRYEEANLALNISYDPDIPPAFGEPNQMAQVINCLMSNSLMYTTEGSVFVQTWSANKDTGTHLYLSICDSGMGIPEDEFPFIYDRFYRGINAGQSTIPGSGLGLAIVKEIIDLHKGIVTFENNADQGGTFTISFPAALQETVVANP